MNMKSLVTTEELSRHLDDPQWLVFDTRHDLMDLDHGREFYAEGHVPGAFFLNLDDDLSATKNGSNGRHPLPERNLFASRMSALGVTPATRIVVYDDAGGVYAARLWWMLRWIGVENVALLDGGYPRWLAERRSVSQEAPQARPAAFDWALQPAMPAVDTESVLKRLNDGQSLLVDARPSDRFRGEVEPFDPVAGHIPGAVNRYFRGNLGPDGAFLQPDRLHSEFEALLQGREATDIVHLCGSGVTACHNLFAMELAGLPGSRLYAGSWSEWVADRSRPVAVGA
jgi:thiosulfate/3-mercaptopyruvate sulfurtransferase